MYIERIVRTHSVSHPKQLRLQQHLLQRLKGSRKYLYCCSSLIIWLPIVYHVICALTWTGHAWKGKQSAHQCILATAFVNAPVPFHKPSYHRIQCDVRNMRCIPHGTLLDRNAKARKIEDDDFLGSFNEGEGDEEYEAENHSIGNNWVMPSKVATDDEEDTDEDVVDFFFEDETVDGALNDSNKLDTPIHFDVGIDGQMMETGPLSLKMWNAIHSRTATMSDLASNPTLRRTLYELILKTTAKQAVNVTLQQSGLQLAVDNDLNDNGWGMIESIRVEPDDVSNGPITTFDSWDSLLSMNSDSDDDTNTNSWKPGTSFSFVLRNVPTFRKAVSLDELLSSIDPDGNLRNQALDAGMMNDQDDTDDDDDDIETEEYNPVTSLKELFEDNYRRVEQSPRVVDDMTSVYTGTKKGGYRIIHARDLLNMVNDINNRLDKDEIITPSLLKHYKNTTMHVMDAFVSHGCLLVDVTDGGIDQSRADSLYRMWQTTESFYQNIANNIENQTALPSWEAVDEAGSVHAKVGYQCLNNGTMSVLETRQRLNDGLLLPIATKELFGTEGYNSMRQAFALITEISQAAIQIVVGASTQEMSRGSDATMAMTGARRLVNELVDNGKPSPISTSNSDNNFPVSMSPHRLLQYTMENTIRNDNDAEIFGAHTDTSFITAVPVAAVPGLEVYDDAAQLWYRPELAAQQWHSRLHQVDDDFDLPWHTHYIVLMPGELLQISSCDEVPAAVHRVVAGQCSITGNHDGTSDSSNALFPPSIRYSAPVLLRGRSGVVFDCERYFGVRSDESSSNRQLNLEESSLIWPVWSECQRMTMDQIYSSLQGKPKPNNK